MKTYRSKAPLRIGLAGGGTDVSPFSDTHGGAILNTTISLYTYASIQPRKDKKIIIRAVDRQESFEIDNCEHIPIDDLLKLQKGVYNRIRKDYLKENVGFELITHIDAPAGSGLGTSSTLVVAILGAFVEWLNLPLGEYDIAQLAYSIEREDLAMAGGKQDQYAATFGGFNFMEFHKDNKVVVNPLRMKRSIANELEFHLLLYYTETSRLSENIIKEQTKNFKGKDSNAVKASLKLKEQAFAMKEALLTRKLKRVGEILDNSWQQKKLLAKNITNPLIDELYQTAKNAGATGGKISGAGGGGFMIFYCEGNSKYDVTKALAQKGGNIQRYTFVNHGLTTWTSKQ